VERWRTALILYLPEVEVAEAPAAVEVDAVPLPPELLAPPPELESAGVLDGLASGLLAPASAVAAVEPGAVCSDDFAGETEERVSFM
jgi:hypothetical protein